jgi:hypothetical protein
LGVEHERRTVNDGKYGEREKRRKERECGVTPFSLSGWRTPTKRQGFEIDKVLYPSCDIAAASDRSDGMASHSSVLGTYGISFLHLPLAGSHDVDRQENDSLAVVR